MINVVILSCVGRSLLIAKVNEPFCVGLGRRFALEGPRALVLALALLLALAARDLAVVLALGLALGL